MYSIFVIPGTSSWKEQFTEALSVSGGGERVGDEQVTAEERRQPPASPSDYFMHCITVFWKVIFAFVPPTGM